MLLVYAYIHMLLVYACYISIRILASFVTRRQEPARPRRTPAPRRRGLRRVDIYIYIYQPSEVLVDVVPVCVVDVLVPVAV